MGFSSSQRQRNEMNRIFEASTEGKVLLRTDKRGTQNVERLQTRELRYQYIYDEYYHDRAVQYHRILNDYVLAFFRKYLYAIPSSLLDGEGNRDKNAELRVRNVRNYRKKDEARISFKFDLRDMLVSGKI